MRLRINLTLPTKVEDIVSAPGGLIQADGPLALAQCAQALEHHSPLGLTCAAAGQSLPKPYQCFTY